ncbi:MAG: IPT/TIG domain-containing protein, partial [Acidimicrobiales bacterium]
VTINGTGFTGATQVRFGPNPPVPFTVVSDSEITTTSPMGSPGPVDVQVTGPGGTSMTSPGDQFTYEGSTTPPPTVSSITPDSGPEAGGTPVTITGVNFSGTTGVMFGPNAASSFTVVSGTEITAVSPPQTFGGPMEVTVTTPAGMSTMSPGSQFTYDIAPFIMGAAGVGFVAGAPDSVTLSTSGYPAPVITVGPGLPSWMVVSSSADQVTLSGTPPVGLRRVYALTVGAVNSAGSATRTETITVGSVPEITSAAAVTLQVGVDRTFRIRATGYPVPYVTETGALPAGLSVTPAGGVITLSGAPSPGSGGVYPVVVEATSATGTTQQALVITVNQKPVFTGPTAATWTHGTSNTLTVTTSDAYPAVTLRVGRGLPSWATFTYNGNGTGTISGDPGVGAVRTEPYRVTIVATTGVAYVTQQFSLTVQ